MIAHRAVPGGYDTSLREATRTAIHGERPFFDPERSESLSERQARLAEADGSELNKEKTNGHAEKPLNN